MCACVCTIIIEKEFLVTGTADAQNARKNNKNIIVCQVGLWNMETTGVLDGIVPARAPPN